jgi:hypothetical protein
MKHSKNIRRKKRLSRKNKKGGFFFSKPKVSPMEVPSGECDVNNLTTLTKFPEVYEKSESGEYIINKNGENELKPLDERLGDLKYMQQNLQNNYIKCCRKGFMGKKNSSPYCKQLDTTFNSIEQHKRDIAGYYGDERDISKIKEKMNDPVQTKSRWKLFGGRKTRKRIYKKH